MPQATSQLARVLACVVLLAAGSARGEDVAKRWRIAVGLGGISPQSEVESDSGNVLRLFDETGRPDLQYIDPRPDAARFNTLGIRPGPAFTLSGQYGVSRMLVVEASVGYTRTEVGNVEMHADVGTAGGFLFNPNFRTFLLSAGDVRMIPLRVSAMARFRPQKRFNPYLGGGIGYQFVDFEASTELEGLVSDLEGAMAKQSFMIPGSTEADPDPTVFVSPNAVAFPFAETVVDLPDSFTWHVLLGAELSFGARWSGFVDLRYTWSAESARILFDGEDVGVAVPNTDDFLGSPLQNATYGPVLITEGGLIDGGARVPNASAPPDTNCMISAAQCIFSQSARDGVNDPGYYYVNGGTFDYTAFEFSIGARYTF